MSERAENLRTGIDCEACLGRKQCPIPDFYANLPDLSSIDSVSAARLIRDIPGLSLFTEDPYMGDNDISVVGFCLRSYEEEIGHPVGELDNEGALAVRRENCGWVQFIFKKESGHEGPQPTDPSPPAARVLI